MEIINEKVLFVIPAYNEEKSILGVINEIKSDANYADILVVNDASSDNTAQIVRANNITCIDNIFNMNYAWAVQTGLKYAHQKSYDYVIQFDADGQHIAKEATKLLECALNDKDTDIVIGSRYLQDTGYKCPLFRKIGTRIFSALIKILCSKKIADPLSGFQCLNKQVIAKYAQAGQYPEYPDANLVVDMLKQGYIIKEIPVKMRLREDGESMHGGIIKPIKYMINMFYTIFIVAIQNVGKKKVK